MSEVNITLYPEGTTEQDVKITWPADTNTRDNFPYEGG